MLCRLCLLMIEEKLKKEGGLENTAEKRLRMRMF